MVYEANDCFIRNGLNISASNIRDLEGKTVAVPLNTMADFAFRRYMAHFNVDVAKMKIVDLAPPDGAKSLADGSVAMACTFGGASTKAGSEAGRPIMTKQQKIEAGIGSFDVISVTEKFATEQADVLRAFLKVTEQANRAWNASNANISVVAKDAGMSIDVTRRQMADFRFPSSKEQQENYFGKGGIVASAVAALGITFANDKNFTKTFDGSFLK